ncbi:ribosomal protein S18-alanine N-acetyltransferase [Bacterioplanoides sp. SCSIO 12839]|uniref:ribosomal protein S18-alanine N-acetyltransferase n=1 Tax=Bacterioplanoides sp. SCSIO 12839 TaxID=2829569 RepID=UPI0021023039|nr:ribosomal protein S18-alanine N-acetyltransferase [Bacterioplanoides sp. SCSIO 12839]UTW48716.1 ribosomal protein S18-alanine N-acetyltransferase [Bacterioplanoides sp. SCSIO 12839]
MIRAAQQSDLEAIMQVEQAAHSHPWAASIMQRYLEKPDVCWVLEYQQRVVAHAVVSVIADQAELLTIAVHPDYQGQGFGKQMAQQVIAVANAASAEQLFLEVRESNASAIALYELLGFCETGRRRNYYPTSGGREDALLFALPLL